MSKMVILYLIPLLLLLPALQAEGELQQVISTVRDIAETVGITESPLLTVARIALIFIVAVLLYELFSHLGVSKSISTAIGMALSLTTVFFIPSGVLAAIFGTYATLFSVLLLLLPISIMLYIVYGIIPGYSTMWHLIRLMVIILCIVIEVSVYAWLLI